MKQVFWFLCASIVPALIAGSFTPVAAQSTSPTPDPFTVQLTSSPTTAFESIMGDMTANGRFVVFVSNGDVATERTETRNNADGNHEIFLADYAQRRIFQITNTKHVLLPVTTPSPTPTPTPTPTPSPTPSPAPTPADLTKVDIEIDNRSPMISLAPALSGGQRVYTIVFSSNAPDPANFDGTKGDLAKDANSEIWTFTLPPVTDVDLTLGAELPLLDIPALGKFQQITKTNASRLPRPASATGAPFFADDNREPAISDDGKLLAFISTRDLVPSVGNTDGNPELFFNTIGSTTFTQGTNTKDAVIGVGLVFQSNPSLSADGSVVSFISSANLLTTNADGNAEIFFAKVAGGALDKDSLKQVTRTLNGPTNANVASPGRRLSRNGALIAFESRATDPKANAAAGTILGLFVYTIATDTFVEVGTRPQFDDIIHFPSFTDYDASLAPASLVFASRVNFRADGTLPPAQSSEGLNTTGSPQVFITSLPVSSSNTFTRLTNSSANVQSLRLATSDTRKRISFSLGGTDFGGGNADGSTEIFYLLTPTITVQSGAVLSFFTGASSMPVAAATPLPSPAPSPTPTPSPVPGAPLGVAAGELTIVRSTIPLAPSTAEVPVGAQVEETRRSPVLPVELNGVSVSVNGAAAGLYFVGSTSKQINFVMPISLPAGLGTVAVNILDAGANTDTLLRGNVQIVPAQPDIFTTSGGPGGRAGAKNALTDTAEPFSVTTNNAPTVIQLNVTGVRNTVRSEISVTVGTTVISGDGILLVQANTKMPGFDLINFTLPASLAGAGDVPIIVTFTRGGVTATSRPADTAPHITIN